MKGKKLQTEERHKGLQHQCNSRGQQRGAQPGTNHRCVLQQPLQRERELTCHGTLRSGAGEREHALRDAGTKQQSPPEQEAKPSASPPTGTRHLGASTGGRDGRTHAWEGSERAPVTGRACARSPAAPGSVRDAQCSQLASETSLYRQQGLPNPGLNVSVPLPLARLRQSPGICQVPANPGAQWWGQERRALRRAGREDGASLTAAAATGRDGLCAWSSPRRDVRSGPPLGDLLFFGVFAFCWPSS